MGTVTDVVSGEPLPGVNILIKDTSKGTTTDFDGNFEFKNVPVNSILVFTYIGFRTQEVIVKNDTPLKVVLIEDTESLDEVVVIGYGTQKKRDLTGAVSIVGAKTLDEIKPIKVEQALQGTVSG